MTINLADWKGMTTIKTSGQYLCINCLLYSQRASTNGIWVIVLLSINTGKNQESWNTPHCQEGYFITVEIKDICMEDWKKGNSTWLSNSIWTLDTIHKLWVDTRAILLFDPNAPNMLQVLATMYRRLEIFLIWTSAKMNRFGVILLTLAFWSPCVSWVTSHMFIIKEDFIISKIGAILILFS